MKNTSKEMFRNKNKQNRVNTRQQAILHMEKQVAQLQAGLAEVTPIFPVRINKLPGDLNYLVQTEEAACNLHSLYNMEREMQAIFEPVEEDVEVLILFGLGCAYALEYASRHFSKLERVIVVEPSVDILQRVLNHREVIERLTRVGTVNFMFNRGAEETAQEIAQQWTQEVKKKYGMAYHLPYRTLFRDYYETMQQTIIGALRKTQASLRTVESNIYLKTQNIINNINAPGIDMGRLLALMKGRPAIMVSAGPSLDKNIHLLEQAKDKAFVVAVGSAIKILYNKGIHPHARAAFSPYPDENTVFDGIEDFENIPLLFANTLDYMVVENYDAPKARMVVIGDELSRYCYEVSQQPCLMVSGGGTIANVTLGLLCRAGCSHIIFTGQDMSMTDNRLYAEGSWSDPRYSEGGDFIREKDIYGNPVLTSKAFLGIRKDIETVIAGYPEITFINATEGGLSIEGTSSMKLAEILEELPPASTLSGEVEELFAGAQYNIPAINRALLLARHEMETILELNRARIEELREILGSEMKTTDLVAALQGLQKYEDQMRELLFYRMVVLAELGTHFYSVRAAHQYTGQDFDKQAESLIQIVIGCSKRVNEYGEFMYELLQKKTENL